MSTTDESSDVLSYESELFELGSLVNMNRAKSHAHRAQISENLSRGMQVVLSAFNQNRNLMNECTTNIFRTRRVLIDAHARQQGLNEHQRKLLMDEVQLNCLRQRSHGNRQTIAVNNAMTRFNTEFINLLETMLTVNNEEMLLNQEESELNHQLLENPISDEALQRLETSIVQGVADLMPQAEENSYSLEEGFEASAANASELESMLERTKAELGEINEVWESIEADQELSRESLGGIAARIRFDS